MRLLHLSGSALAATVAAALLWAPAFAQTANGPAKRFIGPIASNCIENWESQNCLAVLSQSTLVLAANYAEALQNNGHENATETIKQHCAAATAATQQHVPADAMRSAMTECANTIYDVSERTGVAPDQSHYQLLIYPTMCLSGDAGCGAVERGLADYR